MSYRFTQYLRPLHQEHRMCPKVAAWGNIMRKTLVLGTTLLSLLPNVLLAADDVRDDEGEKTYRCWRIEKDSNGNLSEWPIAVEAHSAFEAMELCAAILRERVRKANKEHRYS